MTDVLAIADALAARYASGTLTPPTGYGAVREATARPNNAIATYPHVLVLLPDGELILDSAQQLTLNFHVQFHYGKNTGDVKRDMKGMLSWIGPLLQATAAATTLGLSASQQVKSAIPSTFSLEVFTFAGVESYGWDIEVPVLLRDMGWPVAP